MSLRVDAVRDAGFGLAFGLEVGLSSYGTVIWMGMEHEVNERLMLTDGMASLLKPVSPKSIGVWTGLPTEKDLLGLRLGWPAHDTQDGIGHVQGLAGDFELVAIWGIHLPPEAFLMAARNV